MGQESHPSNGLHPTTTTATTTTTTTTSTPPFRRCAAEYHSVLQCAQRERTKNDFASFHIWCRPHMSEFTRCMQDAQWKDLKSSFSQHPEHEQQQPPQELSSSSFYWTTTATNNMARRWTRVRELLQDELVDEPNELPIRRAKDVFETLLCNEEKDTEREALVQQQQTDTGNDTIQIPITVGRRVQHNDDNDEIRKTTNPAKRDDYYNENLFPFTNKDGSERNLATATTTTTIGNKNSATGDDYDDDDSDKLLRAWLYGRRHVPWMIARHGIRGDTDGDSRNSSSNTGESTNNQMTPTTPAPTPADHVLAMMIQDAQMMAHEVSKNISDAYHQNMHQDGDDHEFSPFTVFSSIFFPNPKKDHQDYDVSDSTNNNNQATSSLFSSFVDELWNHVNSAHERPPFCSYPSSRNDTTMESSSSNNNNNRHDGDRDCLAMPRLFRSSRHPYHHRVDGDNELQQQQQQHTAVDGNPNESNVDVGGRGGVVGGLMRWIKNNGDRNNKNENRNLLNVNSNDKTQTTNVDAAAATPSTVSTTAEETANRAWIQQVLGACNAMSKGGTNELDRLDRFATEYERIQHNHPLITNNSSNNHNNDPKNHKNENAVGMLQAFQLCLELDNLGKQVPAGATATLPSNGTNWHRPLNK